MWKPPVLTLDPDDEYRAYVVAKRVADLYEAKGWGHFLPEGMTQFDNQLPSMRGELAVALHLGLPWNEGDMYLPDIGDDIEVRMSRTERYLTVYSTDKQPYRAYAIQPQGENFLLWGWETCRNVVLRGEPRQTKGDRKCWWLHWDLLHHD